MRCTDSNLNFGARRAPWGCVRIGLTPLQCQRGQTHGETQFMPTYLYKNIETGEIYELVQSMRDEPYTAHPETGAPVKRVLARPAIAFKGSGFYVTDSRGKSGGEGGGSE